MDPIVSTEMRIARAASLLPGVFEGAIHQLSKFEGQEPELEKKRGGRSDLVDFYARHGFDVVRATSKRDRPADELSAVIYEGERASINHNITQLAERFVPGDPYLYGLLSGATHSKLWWLNGLGDDADEALRAIVAPLMPVSDAYTRAVCGYLGLDASRYVARRRSRLAALMFRSSPVPTIDRSSRETAFGTLSKGLRPDEI
jgi:hypothetical protein